MSDNYLVDIPKNPERKHDLLLRLKEHLDTLTDARRKLDDKARFVLTTSSAIVAISNSLLVNQLPATNARAILLLLGLGLAFYLFLAYFSLKAIGPCQHHYPIAANWTVIASLVPLAPDEYLDKLLIAYINAINSNEATNGEKGKLIHRAIGCLIGTSSCVSIAAMLIAALS
jgi:hypothetical protein